MFNLFKKEEFKIVSPADGQLVELSKVPDEMFAQKLMGDGFAVQIANDVIVAPISGEVTAVFPTGHAVGIKNKDGVECIVHIGLDTVNLNGEGFKTLVKVGNHVKAGKEIVEVNKDDLEAKGYNLITMTVFPSGYSESFELKEREVVRGETLVS